MFQLNYANPKVISEIKRLMHKRDRLYSKYKQNRSNPNIKNKFNHLKHIIQRKVRESYNQYIETIVTDQNEVNTEFRRPNKRLYTFVKQKSDSNEITSLKSNDITHTATVEKANILNTQFQSVFTKIIPLKVCNLIEFILPMSLPFPTMPEITISVNGVAKQLSKLNPGKAAGPDGLTSRILKELHTEIAPVLADIYNASLSEGVVPTD